MYRLGNVLRRADARERRGGDDALGGRSLPGVRGLGRDAAEIERFSKLAATWWDPRGPMAPLHKFNPVRLGYIRDQAALHFSRDPKRLDVLNGLRILDIGCGAGRVGCGWSSRSTP